MQFIKDIVAHVKEKKELSTLADAFVKQQIEMYLRQDKKTREKILAAKSFKELKRGNQYKEFIRIIRGELRAVFGVFKLDGEGLAAHKSTEERLPYYDTLYEELFAITGKPASLLDLGCGMNPLSYIHLGCAPRYVAIDLPGTHLDTIRTFFQESGIDGSVHGIDLIADHEKIMEFTVDIAFCFKLLDSLETAKRNISGKVLDAINAKWIIVSFPTISIGGNKEIKEERRAWFERLLRKRNLEWETLKIPNEVFYVVKT